METLERPKILRGRYWSLEGLSEIVLVLLGAF